MGRIPEFSLEAAVKRSRVQSGSWADAEIGAQGPGVWEPLGEALSAGLPCLVSALSLNTTLFPQAWLPSFGVTRRGSRRLAIWAEEGPPPQNKERGPCQFLTGRGGVWARPVGDSPSVRTALGSGSP